MTPLEERARGYAERMMVPDICEVHYTAGALAERQRILKIVDSVIEAGDHDVLHDWFKKIINEE